MREFKLATHFRDRAIEDTSSRLYGKYRGLCKDNKDSLQMGRIRAYVPAIHGGKYREEETLTNWAMPCLPFGGIDEVGFAFVPELDSGVWIEFEEGDILKPIWSGCFWTRPNGETEFPVDALQNRPNVRVLKTRSGHRIIFDDTNGEEYIKIIHSSGKEIIFEPDGKIQIRGVEVICNDGDGQVITTNSLCPYTGSKHIMVSTVKAP